MNITLMNVVAAYQTISHGVGYTCRLIVYVTDNGERIELKVFGKQGATEPKLTTDARMDSLRTVLAQENRP